LSISNFQLPIDGYQTSIFCLDTNVLASGVFYDLPGQYRASKHRYRQSAIGNRQSEMIYCQLAIGNLKSAVVHG